MGTVLTTITRWTLACVALVAACSPARPATRSERGGGERLIDDAGDTVAVAIPARRVVSLVPATTELLFAVGAGDAVVGRTPWCDWPAAASGVPNVGDGIQPNLEAILARKPDLVVLYPSGQNNDAYHRLKELGIPALRLRTDHLADVPRLARLLGHVTGHETQADSVARTFDAELATATAGARTDTVQVFFLAWDKPTMTVGRGSFITELLERAGAANVFGDVAGSSAVVSVEAVAARAPDVVLTLGDDAPKDLDRPEWQVVGAVRDGRTVHVDGSEFSRPSPRAPRAIRELRQALAEVSR
ncbi:MAG TPA: helical backbone metal receptor [Gemmatimonadales bacterium]|nr:helical backbone metal receptor [Gemmatimonadales bacterium]